MKRTKLNFIIDVVAFVGFVVITTTGVPAAYIIEGLKLSESTATEERLDFLKRKYGFEINDVREIVKANKNRKCKILNSPDGMCSV